MLLLSLPLNRLPVFTMALSLPLLLGACQTLTKAECEAGDWYAIGQADGAEGLPASRIDDHAKACVRRGFAVDVDAYHVGRGQGLKTYCTLRSALLNGAEGKALQPVCSVKQLAAMKEPHAFGLTYYRLDQDVSSIRSDLNEAQSNLREIDSADTDAFEKRQRLYAEIARLERSLERAIVERERYRTWPPQDN